MANTSRSNYIKLLPPILLIAISTYLNLFLGSLINNLYPNRQPLADFLFDSLPFVPSAQYLTDAVVLLSGAIVIYYFIKYEKRHLPYALYAFGFFYLLRALLVVLNPVSGYFGTEATFGLTSIKPYGAFPSGHVGFAVVCYLLVSSSVAKYTKAILYFLVIVEAASLLLARGHYGIDIVGGLLLGYFVVSELSKSKENLSI